MKKTFIRMVVLTIFTSLLFSTMVMAEESKVTWQSYNGKRIGVLTGTLMEGIAKEYFPDSEHLYFNSNGDCNAAILAGKIDAFLADEPNMKMLHMEQPSINYIPDKITSQDCAFAFRKNDERSTALCNELNEFIKKLKADGTLATIENIWMGKDEDLKVVDMSGLKGSRGTLKVVTTSSDMPWSYIKDGKNVGYDIDLIVRFCREKNYGLELTDMDMSGRIPAIQSGKFDFSTDMNVTKERQEQVLFSEPTYAGGIVLAVLSKDLEETPTDTSSTSFFDELGASFHRTFIKEGRYNLFLSGVLTTVLITLSSIILGTILGLLIYMGCRTGNRIAKWFAKAYVWFVQGMPAIVLLMILYYIIFARVEIGGTVVAIIAFSLVFGSGVYGMLTTGVGAVDYGQTEAAYALGFGDYHAFFKIILPQALPHCLPAFKGEVVSLVKATAIVGYIAVQDLTRMGDIVRGRTYEAFFPLISVAAIYFLLGGILRTIIGFIEKKVNPKNRNKEQILKGARLHD